MSLTGASPRERACDVLRGTGVSSGVMLFRRSSDVRWLCNFSGSNGEVLLDVRSGNLTLLTDGRYLEQARHEWESMGDSDTEFTVEYISSPADRIEVLRRLVAGQPLLVDAADITHADHTLMVRESIEVLSTENPLAQARRVKQASELRAIERACGIADDALSTVLARGICGLTERQVRIELDFEMLRLGADDVSFETIVATGPNAAMPHHRPGDTVIEPGHLVVIDMGALSDGYHSDMTRTVCVGDVSSELATMLATVREAQAAGVAAVRDGVEAVAVDEACRVPMRRVGLEHLYVHGTGHGVGLDIHEQPFLGPRSAAHLSAGEVVTVEPGLYRGGVGGARVEDLVVVTSSGCRILTQSPKDLTCPPSPRTT